MPEISRFFGVVIRMYFDDHNPAHFHARYAGTTARIRISPVSVLSGEVPPRVLAFVVEWASIHQLELLTNWNRLRSMEQAVPISPLE